MDVKMGSAAAVGGALGAISRYVLSIWMPVVSFPLATLIVNYLGSFILGALTEYAGKKRINEWVRLAIGTGFCGGLTTMSTFSKEMVYMFQIEKEGSALVYFISSLVGGLLFCFLGTNVAARIVETKETLAGE
ncbi:camphor resistance protein CrcB [Thermolongibacillus altinsuensis]|uniref:Fluoride-specific ion channel FluC n=1 Tax=Thermolongibacillus altinsuensis TaxID=575256 RepID=A0A4R1QNF3_9BACL|nr:fluoride efflux transporter CrcB [Thermolongibacillus altinsuensis]TCL49193.1 camphor resistance protein CrcB [Thermolongibacillus altinsuensis]